MSVRSNAEQCDWCDRAVVHRHVSSDGTLLACHLHHPDFLAYRVRARNLAARAETVWVDRVTGRKADAYTPPEDRVTREFWEEQHGV